MGVEITGRDYSNQFRAEITDWLHGNVGDWQKLKLTFKTAVEFRGGTSDLVNIILPNQIVLMNGQTWADYGFDNGYTFFIGYNQTIGVTTLPHLASYVVNQIQGDTLETTTNIAQPPINIIPGTNGTVTISEVVIYSDKRPQGIELTYGHLTNDDVDSLNISSLIDGTLTKFNAINTDVIPVNGVQLMNAIGNQSGMSIGPTYIKYLSKTGTHTYNWEIDIEFMISSVFELVDDLETNTAPSWLLGSNCLTDNFLIKGFPEWNNPNSFVKNDLNDTKRLGNTGWYDENVNGLANNFTVLSLTYSDLLLNGLNELDYANPTKVVALISGVNNLGVNSKFNYGFMWVSQNESDYKVNQFPFYKNLKCNTGLNIATSAFPLGLVYDPTVYQGASNDNAKMNVTNVRFKDVGGDLEFSAEFHPTPEFMALMDGNSDTNRNYVLWVSIGDSALQTSYSDRVSLKLDYRAMIKNVVPAGPYPGMTNLFMEHNESEIGTGVVLYDGFVEDDILCKVNFLKTLSEDRVFTSMLFKIDCVEISTGARLNMQSYNANLSSFPTDGFGVQQFGLDTIRGFKLEPGNNKNWVKVERDLPNDTILEVGYIAYYGFKIRWEDWIEKLSVPNVFFDNAELNNGFNNDWFHYISNPNYEFRFTVDTNSVLNGEAITNENEFPFVFTDYDLNLCINKTHNYFRDSDNALLNIGIDPGTGKPLGVILNDENTRIEIEYAVAPLNVCGLTTFKPYFPFMYATCCIEIDKGAGQFEFRQISTLWGRETDCPLIPVVGETYLKFELLAGDTMVKTTCLVDPTLLEDAIRYKISGRIGILSIFEPSCLGMHFENDDCILLENGNDLIIE